MIPTLGEEQAVGQALRDALIAYLESGETDQEAWERLQHLPGGAQALQEALELKAGLAAFAHTPGSVDEYLEWKREEIEAERQRDEARDAMRP